MSATLEQCEFAINSTNESVCEGCFKRQGRGKGFCYASSDGEIIRCESTKARIKALGIPPAWSDVQICKFSHCKIQAIGKDIKGRAQYIYHPEWTEQQQNRKFSLLPEFAKKTPRIRQKCHSLIGEDLDNRTTILAIATLILAETGMRVGNQKYRRLNKTYGLSTLQMQHIASDDETVKFSFTGKHNKEQTFSVINKALSETLETIIDKYEDDDNRIILSYEEDENVEMISHCEINDFIKKIIGTAFSSKFFRTWTGTRLALFFARDAMRLESEVANASFEAQLVSLVANELGNTPAICRKYYIHPKMLSYLNERFLGGKSFPRFNKRGLGSIRLSPCEKQALSIIDN